MWLSEGSAALLIGYNALWRNKHDLSTINLTKGIYSIIADKVNSNIRALLQYI